MIKTRIETGFDKKKSEIILKSIMPDMSDTKRATTNAGMQNNSLLITIDAEDTTALRAAANSILRLISAAENVLVIDETKNK